MKGTRRLVDNDSYIGQLRQFSLEASSVLTVCTGPALLARTGLIDNQPATTNKRALGWVKSVNPKVNWIEKARRGVTENSYTSSGVSAGMDMVLGILADRFIHKFTSQVANEIEYNWQEDASIDPFH
ncbi:DJ-1/PfpI family protein [uncultured Vagococcus sp.]|uniref:DJ-1/PfpI family protein n=1 Tax=uncultured Vagococcus sp. TaxID=189676 RepID=UPI0028D85D4F|nr:DJ-1/PfpI family protein [uncultured Vagococcus sp.]